MKTEDKLRLLAKALLLDLEGVDGDTATEDDRSNAALAEVFEAAAEEYSQEFTHGVAVSPSRCAQAIWAMARMAKDSDVPGYWSKLRAELEKAETLGPDGSCLRCLQTEKACDQSGCKGGKGCEPGWRSNV